DAVKPGLNNKQVFGNNSQPYIINYKIQSRSQYCHDLLIFGADPYVSSQRFLCMEFDGADGSDCTRHITIFANFEDLFSTLETMGGNPSCGKIMLYKANPAVICLVNITGFVFI